MKGILFFAGSFLRWTVQDPRKSFLLLAYFATLHGFATLLEFHGSSGMGFLFTTAVLAPFVLRICQGLPLDCLYYPAEIERERLSRTLPN